MPTKKHNYFTAFVIATFLAIALTGFGVWAFLGKKDAVDNLDAHIATAVLDAETTLTEQLNEIFEEESKVPYRSVSLVESLGGVTFEFPKNWGVYVVEKESGSIPLTLYAHPNIVPNISGDTAFGLRMEIVDNSYDEELQKFEKEIEKGEVSSKAVRSNEVLGVKLQGGIAKDLNGIMVMFPLRDKTLKFWTEAASFKSEFETALEALVFTP